MPDLDKTVETVETPVVETPIVEEQVTVEPSPTEQKAREQGWVSKEEWVESGRSEDDWRPAKEFVDRGELYKSLHLTKRELKQAQQALTALQRHHAYVFEKAQKQALQELKQARRMAMREEDLERVEEIENEIETLTQEQVQERAQFQAIQQPVTPSVNPEFQAWLNQNPWYLTDTDLQYDTDALALAYANRNPDAPAKVVLDHVDKELRKRFPEKFGVKKAAPNAVASVNRSGNKPPKKDDVVLDEMERGIMETLVRSGVMTEEKYKAELKKAKGG